MPSFDEFTKNKRYFDDPRPFKNTIGPYQVCPKEIIDVLTFDVEKMKTAWVEVVGFRAPDVVGKISPEIKLGKYTWQEVQN
ncbi:MAG: hypothetical protein JRH15_21560, partial [Deltaproteobacteria bacterium]|nr:hypothetical protein [Deltaproteobacteria bacterium]